MKVGSEADQNYQNYILRGMCWLWEAGVCSWWLDSIVQSIVRSQNRSIKVWCCIKLASSHHELVHHVCELDVLDKEPVNVLMVTILRLMINK